MTVLNQIAYFQNRRDEIPNQDLARELCKARNTAGIAEIAKNIWNKNKNVQSDCLKVLYEIGYINAELIAEYFDEFVKLLTNKNNRMVWGGMIAIYTIARQRPDGIMANFDAIKEAINTGSVITVDAGIRALAIAATTSPEYNLAIFPYLLKHIAECRPKDIASRASDIAIAVNDSNQAEFLRILDERNNVLTASQQTRLRRVLKRLKIFAKTE